MQMYTYPQFHDISPDSCIMQGEKRENSDFFYNLYRFFE